VVQSQPGQKVREILTQKTLHKNRAGGVVQGEDPEFKLQYHKKKKKKKKKKEKKRRRKAKDTWGRGGHEALGQLLA
jgi:hypothetical protein